MRKVNGFVTLFIPIGLFPSTIRPLVYAALDLMETRTSKPRQHPGLRARRFCPYHGECKANNFDWDGREVIMKDNPVVVFVLKPGDIDNFLDNGVPI